VAPYRESSDPEIFVLESFGGAEPARPEATARSTGSPSRKPSAPPRARPSSVPPTPNVRRALSSPLPPPGAAQRGVGSSPPSAQSRPPPAPPRSGAAGAAGPLPAFPRDAPLPAFEDKPGAVPAAPAARPAARQAQAAGRAQSRGARRRWLSGELRAALWGLALVAIVGAGYFFVRQHQRLLKQHEALQAQRQRDLKQLASVREKLAQASRQLGSARQAREGLKREFSGVRQQRQSAQSAFVQLSDELSASLGRDIERGHVRVLTRDGKAVVSFDDQLLFAAGTARLTRGGRQRLLKLAEAIRLLPDRVFEVAGHTQSTPLVLPVYRSGMPTNWEVATVRATQVVRYLEQRGKVPGAQLIVAGFAEHRPMVADGAEAESAPTGRIEVTVLGKLPQPSTEDSESSGQ
jgi:chemotaxis protein MotB